MSTTVSSVIPDELQDQIAAFAEYHDISQSAAIKLLIQEGLETRHQRLQQVRIEAKLDAIAEEFINHDRLATYVDDYLERATDDPLETNGPASELDNELPALFASPGKPFADEADNPDPVE